ncbi:MAG: ATP-dependent zinc metalloprotease FtsH [Deltaproteobacteria bacterium]|nr:ATP-dependent zinc metalloprotease FtsH [Deltaproteobacteria bacterium]
MQAQTKFSLWYTLGALAVVLLLDSLVSRSGVPEIAYSEFLTKVEQDQVERVVITTATIYGISKDPNAPPKSAPAPTPAAIVAPSKTTPWRLPLDHLWQQFTGMRERVAAAERAAKSERARSFTVVPLPDDRLIPLLQQHGVDFQGEVTSTWASDFLLNWILPFGAMAAIWLVLMRRMGGGGRGVLSIGQSKAKIYQADASTRVTFADVAGVDEAVEETKEVVAFLQNPAKYTRLGAKLPKGVLLIGPPGTGKTLLARAVAGEAGVPFFSLSGSDFVEMFVGVGASRVRDLFAAAKAKAPCIVFIDELDAVGKRRDVPGFASGGGYDERENTLNQLLVEMDGFDASKGVVLMGATNRPEVLDPALRRPGRFDREILVDRPTKDGRLAILRVHARKLILAPDVDFDRLAGQTTGFVGADLANLCNEAALFASRKGRDAVHMDDFQDAFERVIGGMEKKGKVISEPERRRVAYHESGHALVGYFTPGADPVRKVSIVPRGRGALGYTLQAPLEDRFLMSEGELLGRVRTLLGGRAAEQVVFGEISTGASDDLEKASRIVRQMLTVYGMSKKLPNLSLAENVQGGFLGQGPRELPHSPAIEEAIGDEMLEILRTQFDAACALLTERRAQLEALATRLLAQEKIDEADMREILGEKASPQMNTENHR